MNLKTFAIPPAVYAMASVLLVLMLLITGCPSVQTGHRRQESLKTMTIRVDGWPLRVEVADTPQLHRKGLSERHELRPGYGFLFFFSSPHKPGLTMKDTSFPVSVAFISEEGTILQMADMHPHELLEIKPEEPVKFVLAVRQGFFDDHNIFSGAHVEIPEDITDEVFDEKLNKRVENANCRMRKTGA